MQHPRVKDDRFVGKERVRFACGRSTEFVSSTAVMREGNSIDLTTGLIRVPVCWSKHNDSLTQ